MFAELFQPASYRRDAYASDDVVEKHAVSTGDHELVET